MSMVNTIMLPSGIYMYKMRYIEKKTYYFTQLINHDSSLA